MFQYTLLSAEQEIRDKFLSEIESLSQERGETSDKAFTAWISENLLGIDDSSLIDEAIEIGGPNDFGIDFFCTNDKSDEEKFLAWGQAKFSNTLDHMLTREEFEDFVRTYDRLESPPPTSSSLFKTKANEFAIYKDRIPKRMLLVFTGTTSQQVLDMLNDPTYVATHRDSDTKWEIIDLQRILQHVTVPTTLPLSIKFDGNIIHKTDQTTGRNSLIGYVKGSEIVRICNDPRNKNRIFLENPRDALGSTSSNKEIISTLEDDEKKLIFWKLNNGITATCSKIDENTDEENKFQFDNFKIVNGRQTSWTLTKNKGLVNDDVTLQLIVHEAATTEERSIISKSTNTQNAIKPVDLVTNSPSLRKLVLDFKRHHPTWYFEIQRGGFRNLTNADKTKITKRRMLEKEPSARKFWAFRGKPLWAITVTEKELFLIETNFNNTFENSKAVDFIIPHIFYRLLEELDISWKNDSSKEQNWKILHKRIVKFFIMALITHTLEQMDDQQKKIILEKIYELFTILSKDDPMHTVLLDIVSTAFSYFQIMFDELTAVSVGSMDDEEMKKFLFTQQDFYDKLKHHKEIKSSIQPDPILNKLEQLLPDTT